MLRVLRPSAIVCAAALAWPAAAAHQLNLVNQINLADGGEIVDFDSGSDTLATTGDGTVQLFTLDALLNDSFVVNADFSAAFGAPADLDGVSSTALDNQGRGFGVASLIPAANRTSVGKVGFYNSSTGAVLGTLDVGFHPDSVLFSADGTKVLVANEGEFTGGGEGEGGGGGDTDAPGSLSVIDLSGVGAVGDIAGLTGANVSTFDFSSANLAPGTNYLDLRFNDPTFTGGNEFRHIEPEFMTQIGDKVYVSLQENNAVAEFDLATSKWTALHGLGTITNTIDASDKDGGANINDVIAGLPMPDAVASFSKGGVNYIVTPNEGDARVDDGDLLSFDDGNITRADVDAATQATLDGIYGDFTDKAALGRLGLSAVDGDTDGDGKIEILTAFGTRSFSIYNADTGALVNDSGSLENFLLAEDPTRHNANDGGDPGEFDKRSDNKGPEPEGLDVIVLDDDTVLLAIGMERQNGIILADITDPTNIQLIDYINNHDQGLLSPESLRFIAPADSPNGELVLLVGYEGEDGAGNGVGIYTVVPEPGTLGLAAGMGAMALLRRRRVRRMA